MSTNSVTVTFKAKPIAAANIIKTACLYNSVTVTFKAKPIAAANIIKTACLYISGGAPQGGQGGRPPPQLEHWGASPPQL